MNIVMKNEKILTFAHTIAVRGNPKRWSARFDSTAGNAEAKESVFSALSNSACDFMIVSATNKLAPHCAHTKKVDTAISL